MRLISDALADHPAARKAGLLRTEELTLIKRSPMPSFMLDRYDVRRYQIAKLDRHNQQLHAGRSSGGDESFLPCAMKSRKRTYSSFCSNAMLLAQVCNLHFHVWCFQ